MKAKNRYINLSPESIEHAREMDLLTYLRTYEPDNLVRMSSQVYRTKDHDSLKISNGKWYWWSQSIGGASALDYLIKVRGVRFPEAVQMLTGNAVTPAPKVMEKSKETVKALYLPERNASCEQVVNYLTGRGIDRDIIKDCVTEGLIYESKPYHNAVFVGRDDDGMARYAACRSTLGTPFKQDAAGSDKRYSFRLLSDEPSSSLHLFEAAIDLLSYATLIKQKNQDYKTQNLLSLSGVYQPKKDIKSSKIPVVLSEFLKKNPQIRRIYLHLDNDRAGRMSTKALIELLKNEYEIVDYPAPVGKDINDFLLYKLRNSAEKAHSGRQERGDVR